MRVIRLEVGKKPGVRDRRAEEIARDLELAALAGVTRVTVRTVYQLAGNLRNSELQRLVEEVLLDPIVEELVRPERSATAVDIAPRPGVTDAAAEAVRTAARLLGLEHLAHVSTGRLVRVEGDVDPAALERVAAEVLAHPVIERWAVGAFLPVSFEGSASSGAVATVPLRGADDARRAAISAERRLALDGAEMLAIAEHFAALGRDPTDVELETLAQTWSEHCAHKTFRARIAYREHRADGGLDDAASGVIDDLLATTIRAATERLARPWVRSAFVDNAGVVSFEPGLDVAFKVETHNHPSALEPFGGAHTGVGGVVRDILGVSARPVAVTDVLCFGPLDTPAAALPAGVLPPRRVARGVVAGVADYGNTMGLPTVNGAVLFDPGYLAIPLVYCGALGVAPTGAHPTAPAPDDLVVLLGGATGRDGLRGATFSSMAMDADTGRASGGAVQVGHPLHEKQVLEVVLAARDAGLYHAITDCGAGGLSSAIGEMARALGADVELTRVPLKYPGLEPWEIWLSEAQERMVLAVPAERWDALAALARLHGIGCDPLGTFRRDGRLRLTWEGHVVAELDGTFLHDGMPQRQLTATWTPPPPAPPEPPPASLVAALLARLADPNVASKEGIVRRYDHEVQGGTVVKPWVGVAGDGPGDAAVLALPESPGPNGLALGAGLDPRLGLHDPYAMAWCAVDEALRNVVAVGADPTRVALLDNFCWGDPLDPESLGALVRCARGAHDAALAYGAPFVSGKDSLNNTWVDAAGRRQSIPPTLLISALGHVPDVARAATSALVAPGDAVYLVGLTRPERLPTAEAPAAFAALHGAIAGGLVRACHDLSEGGLLVAAAEMALGGRLGLALDLAAVPRDPSLSPGATALLERPSRLLVEVAPADIDAFEAALDGVVHARVGEVTAAPELVLRGAGPEERVGVEALRHAFAVEGAPRID